MRGRKRISGGSAHRCSMKSKAEQPRRSIVPLAVGVLLLLAASQGCVSRSMTIRSEPEGARVYLDGKYLGETPVRADFKYYGHRRIRLEKEGLQTLSKRVKMRAPWYQIFPFDFFCEVLVPHRFKDEREFSFSLKPPEHQKENLLQRANEQRKFLFQDTPP